MNGKETRDDLDRCKLWDAIYTDGPTGVGELSAKTGIASRRITALICHSWFASQHGLVYITAAGGKRTRLMLAS
jgi:hypothetical protein